MTLNAGQPLLDDPRVDPAGKRREPDGGAWAVLDRMGFQKYLVVTLFTAMAFGLTIGAYIYDRPSLVAAAAPPVDGTEVRLAVEPVYLFSAGRDVYGGAGAFSLYDIGRSDTPDTARRKLAERGFSLTMRSKDNCRFAYAATASEAAGRELRLLERIRAKNEACCALFGEYGEQLQVYNFRFDGSEKAAADPVRDSLRGALVFSGVNGELLAVYVKLRAVDENAFSNAADRLRGEYGPPSAASDGAAHWVRNCGLLFLAYGDGGLSAGILHGGNIDRHTARLTALVEERRRLRQADTDRLLARNTVKRLP